MLNGELLPAKKPDIDNIVKAVLDALNETKKAEAKNILLIRCLQGIRNSKCRKCKTVVI